MSGISRRFLDLRIIEETISEIAKLADNQGVD